MHRATKPLSKHPIYISRARLVRSLVHLLLSHPVRSPTATLYQKKSVSFLGKVSVVDRILVSLSHVRRAQSSPLNEVSNFLESRSASHSVFLSIFRNSDIDAYRACGEYSFGKLAFILNLEWSSRVPTYEFLFCFLGRKCLYRIVQIHRREALEGV